MTTGIGMPFSMLAVLELNAFTNSMPLRPRWPKAGPIGGAMVALPAATCRLICPTTFFAMHTPVRWPDRGARQGPWYGRRRLAAVSSFHDRKNKQRYRRQGSLVA